MEVKANRVSGNEQLQNPGDYYFDLDPVGECHYIFIFCPCGKCDRTYRMQLPVNTGIKQDRAWLWDGNEDCPTLTPSILRRVDTQENTEYEIKGHKCDWHGYLTQGVFRSC